MGRTHSYDEPPVLDQTPAYPLQPDGPFRVAVRWRGMFYDEIYEQQLEGEELEFFEDRAASFLMRMHG